MSTTYLTEAEVRALPDGTRVAMEREGDPSLLYGDIRKATSHINPISRGWSAMTISDWISWGFSIRLITQNEQSQIDAQTALEALRDKCSAFVETATQSNIEAIEGMGEK